MQKIKKITFLLFLMIVSNSVFSQSAGKDTSLCELKYKLTAIGDGYWTRVSGPAVTFIPATDQGDASNNGNRNALIQAADIGELVLKWTTASSNEEVTLKFFKTPKANAGLYKTTQICGNSIQLNASLDPDPSAKSVGSWILNPDGFFGYSEGEHDDAAISEKDAWFYHSTGVNPGVDSIYVYWLEYNADYSGCATKDSVHISFWYKDTAYIKLGTVKDNYIDSVCGRAYSKISANDQMPTNKYSLGYWNSVDGSSIDWYKDGNSSSNTEPQLDSIKIGSNAQEAFVWKDIEWIIQNGRIYGNSKPPVCSDTSHIVRIRFDNTVISEIKESHTYPDFLINCGDSICLNATSIFDWTHYQWEPNIGEYSYYKTGYSGDRADTLPSPCLAANAINYPNTDYPGEGSDTHRDIFLKAINGMCLDIDTISITWAPIPTGEFYITNPTCVGDSATLFIKNTGLDININEVKWFFDKNDIPVINPISNSKDTIAVYWNNSINSKIFRHAVSAKTTNKWGCTYTKLPPDTVIEPHPSYVKFVLKEHPSCGEEDGKISFTNYSDVKPYTVRWASNQEFLPTMGSDEIKPKDTIKLNQLFASDYYLIVSYQAGLNNCKDTLHYNLFTDPSTIASSKYEYITDTSDLYAPFELEAGSINNISKNANKYTWQIFSGKEEDLSLLIYEGNDIIPNYTFRNMGEYLIKLQATNKDAPNCPSLPYTSDIFVHYESVVEVPNIFTPNGDGYNDEFIIKAKELETYRCVIYNRWGKKVFETDNPETNWNGKQMNDGGDCSPGSYYYVVTGTGTRKQKFEFKGALQLLKDN